MKLPILFFLIPVIVFGQIQTNEPGAEPAGLIQILMISNQDVTGQIYKGEGLGGNRIELNSVINPLLN